jgi:predicted DNA-binding transcriptional regulator AlpA
MQPMPDQATSPSFKDDDDRILSKEEVKYLTGLSETSQWRERKAGRFPKLLDLSGNRKGNTLGQIRGWIRARREAAEAPEAPPRPRGRPRQPGASN